MRQHHERTPTYSLVSIGPDARSAVGHRGQDDRQLSELQAARIIHFLKSHALPRACCADMPKARSGNALSRPCKQWRRALCRHDGPRKRLMSASGRDCGVRFAEALMAAMGRKPTVFTLGAVR